MIGRQVIEVKEPMTLQELADFMEVNWDKEKYGTFTIGRPTPISIEEYIILPATYRFLIIVYPRAAGGLFSKSNKVILSTADTPESAKMAVAEYMPSGNAIMKLWQTSSVLSSEKERKGPAEEALQLYTAHMKEILSKNGLIKE